MAFRGVNFARLARFNSAASSDFLDMYENYVKEKIAAEQSKPSARTFAPSGFRCARKQWFRLRGTEPDGVKVVDLGLNFTAEIGTACHRIIQSNLKNALGSDWVDVSDFLKDHPIPYEYTLTPSEDGLETKIEIENPPIRFACDGIIFWKGHFWLLEIKTAEYSSFDELTDPKNEHVDQIETYATMLGLDRVLVLYQDRQHGGLKCYEMHITQEDKISIIHKMELVIEAVETNLAPEGLPKGDPWCSASRCPYYKKCKEWG